MAQLLSTNVSGTLAVTQNVNVAGNLIVSGYNVLNEIFQADNLARVSANSGATQSAVALNFVNTATVQVSVASGGAGVANIGFTSTATGGGTGTLNNFPVSVNTGSTITSNGLNFINSSSVTVTVTPGINGNSNISFTSLSVGGSVQSVATGLGLTGGTITVNGTISANIANTTVQGVTKLIDSVTSTDAANAATGAAVKVAFDQATTAYGQANLAYAAANTGLNKTQVSANGGSVQTNVAINFNNTSSIQVTVGAGTSGNANVSFNAVSGSTTTAGILQLTDSTTSTSTTTAATPNSVKTAFDQATLAYGVANTANTTSIAAYGAANSAANTVQVSANSGGTISKTSLNFNNTATIRVNLGPGSAGNANLSFDYIGSVSGGSGINNFPVSANSGSTVTANGLNFLNSAFIRASISSGTTGNANVTLSLTENVTVTSLNVTNIQNSSSNVFVRRSNFVVDTSHLTKDLTGFNPYGIIHLGYSEPSFGYSNVDGYAFVQNVNGSVTGLSLLNANTGSSARIGQYMQIGLNGNDYYYTTLSQNIVSLDTGVKNFEILFNGIGGTSGNLLITDSTYGTIATFRGNGVSTIDNTLFVGSTNVVPAIASAANTVRVAANSGSIQSAVGLNFNNTATIRVNVGTGTTGNANISFDYIGSVTGGGGGGINNFPVSANSGSTVTANGLNFVNSSSILVSVAAGTSGNASVTLTATNISDDLKILSGVNNESNVRILSDNRLTEWSHLENGNIFPLVNEATPQGVFAGNNGNSIYVVGQAQDNVTQYNLSTAWNVATASFASNLSISAQETASVDLFFKNDGSVLYVLGDSGNDITYYTLGTPWSVGGTVTLGGTYSVSAQTSAPRGMFISNDGAKMLVSSSTQVFQYTVATPWDLTTASYDNKSYTQVEDTSGQAVSMNPSGTRMLILGSTNDYIYEYALSTANDVTTAAYTGRKKSSNRRQATSSAEDVASGMYVAYSNNRMYLVGTTLDEIIEYNLDKGLTIETNTLSVEGAGHFTDSLFVGGDIQVASSIDINNQLNVAGATTFDGTPIIFNGATFSWNGQTGTFGTSTANSTYTLGTGATLASRTKTIDIGTNGVAGSFTNITVGPTGVSANVNINANTTTFSNTVNIGNQLVVSGLNILSELGIAENTARVSANSGSIQNGVAINFINTASVLVSVAAGSAGNADISLVGIISAGTVANTATITPVRTGPHSHYAVTSLATAATVNPPAINTGVDGDRLTLRILDNGTGRALSWNTSAGAYRAIGVTLPTTTVASKVLYVGCIYNSQNNFWDAVAFVQQA